MSVVGRIAVNVHAVAARCSQLGSLIGELDSDATGFYDYADHAASANSGGAADAFARFNDLGLRTVAAGLTAHNNTRAFMGRAAVEIEGLDEALARNTLPVEGR